MLGDEDQPEFAPDGGRVFFHFVPSDSIYVVGTSGPSKPTMLARHGRNPRISHDGQHLAFWIEDEQKHGKVFVLDLRSMSVHLASPEFSDARYPLWSPNDKELVFIGVKGEESIAKGGDWWVTRENVETLSVGVPQILSNKVQLPFPLGWIKSRLFFIEKDGGHLRSVELSEAFRPMSTPTPVMREDIPVAAAAISNSGRMYLQLSKPLESLWIIETSKERHGLQSRIILDLKNPFRPRFLRMARRSSLWLKWMVWPRCSCAS